MVRGWLVGAVLIVGCVAGAREAAPTPCPHPYFPMENGLTLTYRAGKAEVEISYTDVRTMGEITKGVLHMKHKGRDGQTEAVCGVDGIHTQLGGIEGAALNMSGMDVTVTSSEGVAMPPPGKMVPGATWTNTLGLELRPPNGKAAGIALAKTTFRKEATIERHEQIDVAGKTWDALRVKNKVTAMAGTAGERTMESIMWLAPGVGILKIQTGDTVDFELLKVDRPAPAVKKPKQARRPGKT